MTKYTADQFPKYRRIRIAGEARDRIVLYVRSTPTQTGSHGVVVTAHPEGDPENIRGYSVNWDRTDFLCFAPYQPEDFPEGTVVKVTGNENAVVSHTVAAQRSGDSDVTQFSIVSRWPEDMDLIPNWSETRFERIISRPDEKEKEKAPRVQDSQFEIGQTVRVTPQINGITGSVTGQIRSYGSGTIDINVAFDTLTFPLNSSMYQIAVVEKTFTEKLNELPVRTILDGKGDNTGYFIVKLRNTTWASSGGHLISTKNLSTDWILPNV